jgi:hypothetical protein
LSRFRQLKKTPDFSAEVKQTHPVKHKCLFRNCQTLWLRLA